MSVRNILNYTNNEDKYIISKSGSSLFKEGYEKYTNFSKNYLDVYSESTTFNSDETVLFNI